MTKRRSGIPKLQLPSFGKPMPRIRTNYTGWWTTIRQRQLTQFPLCARCGLVATVVHHIVPIEAGGHRFDYSNLESLCEPCHRLHHSHRADNH